MVRRVYHKQCGGLIVQRTIVSTGAIVMGDSPNGKIVEEEEPLGEQEVILRELVCEDCRAAIRGTVVNFANAVEVREYRDGVDGYKILKYKFLEGF